MEIKAVLLVVSAIVAVAAASPLEELAAKASIVRRYDCNENAIHYTSIGYRNYALKGCTTRRESQQLETAVNIFQYFFYFYRWHTLR